MNRLSRRRGRVFVVTVFSCAFGTICAMFFLDWLILNWLRRSKTTQVSWLRRSKTIRGSWLRRSKTTQVSWLRRSKTIRGSWFRRSKIIQGSWLRRMLVFTSLFGAI